jgi:hypothetical protein
MLDCCIVLDHETTQGDGENVGQEGHETDSRKLWMASVVCSEQTELRGQRAIIEIN